MNIKHSAPPPTTLRRKSLSIDGGSRDIPSLFFFISESKITRRLVTKRRYVRTMPLNSAALLRPLFYLTVRLRGRGNTRHIRRVFAPMTWRNSHETLSKATSTRALDQLNLNSSNSPSNVKAISLFVACDKFSIDYISIHS